MTRFGYNIIVGIVAAVIILTLQKLFYPNIDFWPLFVVFYVGSFFGSMSDFIGRDLGYRK